VKEKGGLRSWLQKYPSLFQVSGQPGKESVTLLLGSMGGADAAAAGMAATGGGGGAPGFAPAGLPAATGAMAENGTMLAPAPSCPGQPPTELAAVQNCLMVDMNGGDLDQRKREEEEENESAVQLRGLPYRSTVADIKCFLGKHAEFLKDDSQSVQLVLNRDGRPSGFARVQFNCPAAARKARDDLHNHFMEIPSQNGMPPAVSSANNVGPGGQERYVEIFLFSERPNKLRFKKTATAEGAPGVAEEEDVEALGVTKDQVIVECREHMNSPGKGRLLLSMLGVALSQGARLYLKKTDQGLKHFLSQYPMEFHVDGAKGRECVSYLPALASGGQNNSDLPMNFPDSQKKAAYRRQLDGTGGPATGSIVDLQRGGREDVNLGICMVPQSPKVTCVDTSDTPKGINTPSDWGTPQPFDIYQDPSVTSRPSAHRHKPAEPALPRTDAGASVVGAPPPFVPQANGAANAAAYGNWSAWAMPPPTFWPAYWPPQGSAPPPFYGAPPLAGGDPSELRQPLPLDVGTAPAAMQGGQAPRMSAAQMAAVLEALSGTVGALPPTAADTQSAEPGWVQLDQPGGINQAPPRASQPPAPLPQSAAAPHVAALQQAGQDGSASCAVRLRGLPFQATEQDVLAFFSKHEIVDRVSESSNAIKILTKASGKPSGQAVVQMNTPQDAYLALQVLNGCYMGSRYIEVWIHNEGEGMQNQSGNPGPAGNTGGTGTPAHGGGAQRPVVPGPVPAGPLTTENMMLCRQEMPQGQHGKQSPEQEGFGGASLFDGAGDTGGSGGATPMMHNFQNPWDSNQWWAATPSPGGPGNQVGDLHMAQAPVAGTGDGGCGRKDDDQPADWEALFAFLKRDEMEPPMPSAAAINGLGVPTDLGGAGSREPLQGNGRQLNSM
jgi:RNA recognition motif-containing protein